MEFSLISRSIFRAVFVLCFENWQYGKEYRLHVTERYMAETAGYTDLCIRNTKEWTVEILDWQCIREEWERERETEWDREKNGQTETQSERESEDKESERESEDKQTERSCFFSTEK